MGNLIEGKIFYGFILVSTVFYSFYLPKKKKLKLIDYGILADRKKYKILQNIFFQLTIRKQQDQICVIQLLGTAKKFFALFSQFQMYTTLTWNKWHG